MKEENEEKEEKEEVNYTYMKCLGSLEEQKEYLGNILWDKISKNSIIIDKNIDIDIISKICGMILGIEDINEIFGVAVNEGKINERIREALFLLGIE